MIYHYRPLLSKAFGTVLIVRFEILITQKNGILHNKQHIVNFNETTVHCRVGETDYQSKKNSRRQKPVGQFDFRSYKT